MVLIEFLSSVRTRCGIVHPLWFMSDMAEQYYLAWVSVFDSTPRKLLCTWHVHRAWRGELQQHVTVVEKQAAVYRKLGTLGGDRKSQIHLPPWQGNTAPHIRYLSQETLRNPTKSAEIPRGFRKAFVQLSAELQYYFRGECLPFPRNDTSLSAE